MKPEIDEAAVWQRVQAASQVPIPSQSKAGYNKESLIQALEAGQALEAIYGRLSRKGNAGFPPLFEGQRRENRQLLGLCMLLGGSKPKTCPPEKSSPRSYPQLLRWLLCRQQEQLQRLSDLSSAAPCPQGRLLSQLEEQALFRWAHLVEELGRSS